MKLSNLQKVLWVLAGAAAFVFIWLLMWADYRADLAQAETEPPFFAQFELTDHRGMVQTDEDFAGRWMLVFFGFTNCPDVCPTTLSEVAAVMEGLGDEAAKVQPIFITIDPERDTPSRLRQYALEFTDDHDHWLFLTGHLDYIRKIGAERFELSVQRQSHAERLVVVDKWGNTRGIFNWLDADKVLEMEQLIGLLLKEESEPDEYIQKREQRQETIRQMKEDGSIEL